MLAILLLVMGAEPVPKFKPETAAERWNGIVRKVEAGQRVTLYAGVPLPAKAEANAVKVDAIPGGEDPAGVYDCFKGADGKAKMQLRAKDDVSTLNAANKPKTVKGHSHRCPVDGTTWTHADNDPTASHNCPKCGRQVLEQHEQNVAVEAKPAKPVGKPKRIFDGRYYWDEYPDGTRVWCEACNRGR